MTPFPLHQSQTSVFAQKTPSSQIAKSEKVSWQAIILSSSRLSRFASKYRISEASDTYFPLLSRLMTVQRSGAENISTKCNHAKTLNDV